MKRVRLFLIIFLVIEALSLIVNLLGSWNPDIMDFLRASYRSDVWAVLYIIKMICVIFALYYSYKGKK